MNYDVIIIGAGAAGMTAAIFAGRSGARVCVVEHRSEPGKKILQTGNGKCNLTHEGVCGDDYGQELTAGSGSLPDLVEFLDKAFVRFGYRDTLSFFNSIGIPVRNKSGYIYPYSGTALSVRNALWDEMKRLGIDIMTDTEPRIKAQDGLFAVSVVTKKKKDGMDSEFTAEL